MEENIKTIREACIKANPEIVKLKFGCMVEEKIAFGSKFRGETFKGKRIFPLVQKDTADQWIFLTDTGMGRESEDKILDWHTVIGREIRLADVLLAIKNNQPGERGKEVLHICSEGLSAEIQQLVCIWNLKQDSLEAQSPETIEFITNLLTN